MGLKFLVKEQFQLPQMNAVRCPEGVDEAAVRKTLLNEFGLEIGAGLGPLAGKIWRFGLMGYSCRPDNVMLCLSALGSVLEDLGYAVHVGDAEAAAPEGGAGRRDAEAAAPGGGAEAAAPGGGRREVSPRRARLFAGMRAIEAYEREVSTRVLAGLSAIPGLVVHGLADLLVDGQVEGGARWTAGTAAIWSSLFTVGNVLYGRWNYAILLSGVFLVSGLLLLHVMNRLWGSRNNRG
jgi:hypothetical protein